MAMGDKRWTDLVEPKTYREFFEMIHRYSGAFLNISDKEAEAALDAMNEVFSELPTAAYKVGDRVRIKKERIGLEWTIVEVIMPTEEKKAIQYKLVRSSEEEGHRVVQCVREGKIEKVEDVKQEPKFKVGDWVRNDKGEVLKIDGIIPFVYMTGTDFIYYVKEGSTYLECELGFYAPKEGEFTVAMRGNNNPHGDSIMCYSKPHATIDTASWFSYMVDSDESLYFGDWTNQIESHRPATEEEKQTLIKAVEEGYNKTYCEETKEWVAVNERSKYYDPATIAKHCAICYRGADSVNVNMWNSKGEKIHVEACAVVTQEDGTHYLTQYNKGMDVLIPADIVRLRFTTYIDGGIDNRYDIANGDILPTEPFEHSRGVPVFSEEITSMSKEELEDIAVNLLGWKRKPSEDEAGMKFDDKKPRMDLLPFDSLEEVAKVLTFGAKKYAPNNWQKVEDGEDRYTAALMRHLTAHKNGETYDKDSGLSHLSHVACNALFLVHFLNRGEQCD